MARQDEVRKIINCSRLEGEVSPPGDKSISHRAAILNSLADGEAEIGNYSPGRDCLATVNCLRALGIKIRRFPRHYEPFASCHSEEAKRPKNLLFTSLRASAHQDRLREATSLSVSGSGLKEAENVLNAENSATTMRLLAGLLSSQPFLSVITGDASLRSRPMGRLIEPLRLMDAKIWGRAGDSLAPLVIKGGELQGIDYELPVPSAQLKSAILLAGLFAQSNTMLHQPVPSRDHTERMLKQMGANIESQENSISLTPLTRPLFPLSIHVPGDISSAAYLLVAGAIHPSARIVIRDCGINPTRTGIIDILVAMGAKIKVENERWEAGEPLAGIVVQSSELKGIEIGGENIPRLIDEIPVLAVAGCVARGKTVIRDARELRVKDSDRIATICQELSKLGAEIEELPDGMIIHGGKPLTGAEVNSHGDHRLAMSLAIAGQIAKGETTINQSQVVGISYRSFWQDLSSLRAEGEAISGRTFDF